MLGFFERLVDPYPDNEPPPPPKGVFPFVWACTVGVRRFVLVMTVATAIIGAFEALLFAVLGRVVDWLTPCSRHRPGWRQRTSYRATVLQVLAALDGVARASERTYQAPAVANFQVNRARPAASAVT